MGEAFFSTAIFILQNLKIHTYQNTTRNALTHGQLLMVAHLPHDIMNEIIWNNKLICIKNMSVYRNDLIRVGILKVGDLINENNVFLHEIADIQNGKEHYKLPPA